MSTRSRRTSFIVAVIVTLVIAIVGGVQARVVDIDCQLGTHDCPAEVTSSFFSLKGTSLILTDLEQASRVAIQDQTAYRVVGVTKKFPHQIRIELESQTLVYQLKLVGQDTYAAVTDQARLIERPLDTQIPLLLLEPMVWDEWQSAGQVPAQIHSQLRELPLLLGETGLSTQTVVVIDDQTLAVSVANQPTAVVDILEVKSDLSRLAAILRGLQSQELPQPIEEIDLRFKLPVLRFTRTITRHESL